MYAGVGTIQIWRGGNNHSRRSNVLSDNSCCGRCAAVHGVGYGDDVIALQIHGRVLQGRCKASGAAPCISNAGSGGTGMDDQRSNCAS